MTRAPMSAALASVLEQAVWLTESTSEAENVLIAALAALTGEDERETLAIAVKVARVLADHRKTHYTTNTPHRNPERKHVS